MIQIGQGIPTEPKRLPIKVDAGEFVLILRPVSEEDRLYDEGLQNKFWIESDPDRAARLHVARELAFYRLIVDWEGVTSKAADGSEVPVPFAWGPFLTLLLVPGVRKALTDPLARHFAGFTEGEPKAGAGESAQ